MLVHLFYTESGRRLEAQLLDQLLGVRWPGNLGPAQLARVLEGHDGVVTVAGLELDMGALVARVGAVLRGRTRCVATYDKAGGGDPAARAGGQGVNRFRRP